MADVEGRRPAAWRFVRAVVRAQRHGVAGAVLSGLLWQTGAVAAPLVVGFSRKSSLGKLLGDPDATTGSTAASVGAAVAAYERGATILRVHDVREHVEALAAAAAALP